MIDEILKDIKRLADTGVPVSSETLREVVRKHEPQREPQVGDVWEHNRFKYLMLESSTGYDHFPVVALCITNLTGKGGRAWVSNISVKEIAEHGAYIGRIIDYLRERLCGGGA